MVWFPLCNRTRYLVCSHRFVADIMLGLPRRWIRQLGYVGVLLMFCIGLVLVANKQRLIVLDDYLGAGFTPSFFQPSSDLYIVDIAIRSCFKLGSALSECGVPGKNEGVLGNLGLSGEWVKIDKDLTLGNSWVQKQYFSYKKAKYEALDGKISMEGDQENAGKREEKLVDQVIIDIAIANPAKDATLPGNEKLKLPYDLAANFFSGTPYDDEEHTALVDSQRAQMKGKLTAVTVEKHKAASNEINRINLENERKEAEKEKEEKAAKEAEKKGEKAEAKKKANDDSGNKKRTEETSRHALKTSITMPSMDQVKARGWRYKSHGIWVRYGPPSHKNAITGIDILFGEGAVDPRPNWQLNTKGHIQGISTTADRKPYLTIRRGPKLDYKSKQYQTPLKMNKNGKFKILQVADLHLATGNGKCRDPVPAESAKNCLADPRTLKFLNTMLDTEKPDMVVLTGDQIFGDNAPDAETAVFKALDPIIKRKIPYAVTMGNHDDEGSMTRQEIMSLSANIPYSVAAVGPEAVAGVGNYVVPIEGYSTHNTAITLYFLDTHKYSPNPKVNPGYDWIKESQLKWLEEEGASLQKSSAAYSKMHMSMAFFHIPLPEYRNIDGQTKVGELREGVTAPRYNTGARSVLGKLGVSVVSVGHDHCNDYCVLDVQDKDSSRENRMWLCYGGGSGEGGYGGYNGYIRRMRVYEINTNDGKIETWKRLESQTGKEVDRYTLVSEGKLA